LGSSGSSSSTTSLRFKKETWNFEFGLLEMQQRSYLRWVFEAKNARLTSDPRRREFHARHPTFPLSCFSLGAQESSGIQ
jgi:hypothetical protein